MGIMVYSLLWEMQDFVHQPYKPQIKMQNSGLGAVSGTSHARRKYDLGDLALDVGEGVTRSAKTNSTSARAALFRKALRLS